MNAHGRSRRETIWCATGVTIFFLLLLLALVARAMPRELNRDEEQFISAGALLARNGYLPYLDYPYFHLPNLAYVFAALFTQSDHLLLAARGFNVLCAWLTLFLIFGLTGFAFRTIPSLRWTIAGMATLVLFANQLFGFTTGRAWNHDLAVLASLAALAALLRSNHEKKRVIWVNVSGLLLGIAIGTRLTFLPLVLPFAFFVAAYQTTLRGRLVTLSLFLIALAVALLPSWILWARAPSQFVFDNLTYSSTLNRIYAASIGKPGVWLSRKLLFPVKLLKFPQNLGLCVAFIYLALWLPTRSGLRSFFSDRELAPTVSCVPFLLIGAFAPSPSYKQYYYALVPFLVVAVAFGLARTWNTPDERPARVVAGILAAISVTNFALDLPILRYLASPRAWTALRVHETGQYLRTFTTSKVLTLSPIFPLEGGIGIYQEFATGPFAWRAAPFVRDDLKPSLKMTDAARLEEFLASAPPAAILTGFDTNDLEQPLNVYARKHNYRLRRIPDGLYLWLPPL